MLKKKIAVSRPGRVPLGVIPGSSCRVTPHHCVTLLYHHLRPDCPFAQCFPVLTKVTVIAPPVPVSSHLTLPPLSPQVQILHIGAS